jgi:hypothetical protein
MTSYVSPFTGDVVQPTDVSFRAISLTANTTLSWPINGNASGDYVARIMQVTPSTAGLSLTMPPANQVSVGEDSLIRNMTGTAFTVKDNAGGTIVTVAANKAQYVYITTNSTAAGTWGVIDFGAGTSSADSATLAGLGLLAVSTTLNQSHPATTFSANYTFVTADRAQTKVWVSGTGTVNLPAVASVGDNYFFLLKNNGTGSLTLDCYGSQTIDLGLTKIFAPDESAFVVCTGSEWLTIGYGQSSNFVFSSLVKPVVTGSYNITPSEASNTIQEYVGTLTGNVTAYYPPAVNFYVISNQTVDNGFTLTVSTGVSGGFNAVIPVGAQVTLICDGTNFLNANTVQVGATNLSIVSGTATLPGMNFAAETNTGIYRPGTGQLNMSILGTQRLNLTATGLTIVGTVNGTTGTFTTGIAGGVFT